LCDLAFDDFRFDGVDLVNVAEDRVEVEIELPAKEMPEADTSIDLRWVLNRHHLKIINEMIYFILNVEYFTRRKESKLPCILLLFKAKCLQLTTPEFALKSWIATPALLA
jgi:hypothetical protein